MIKKLFGKLFASGRKGSKGNGEIEYKQSRYLLKEYENIQQIMSTSSVEARVTSVITKTLRNNIADYVEYGKIDYNYEHYIYCKAGIDVRKAITDVKDELSKSGFKVNDESQSIMELLLRIVSYMRVVNSSVNVGVREKWSPYFSKIMWGTTYQFTSSTSPAVIRRVIKENVNENVKEAVEDKNFKKNVELLSSYIAKHSYESEEKYWELYEKTVNLVEETQVQLEMFIENYLAMIEAKAFTLVPTITTVKSSIEWAVTARDVTVLSKAYEIMAEVKEELDRSYNEVVQYEQEYVEDVNNTLSNHYLNLLEREKEYMERTEELRKVDSALKASTVVLKDIKED